MRQVISALAVVCAVAATTTLSAANAAPERVQASLTASGLSFVHVTTGGRLALLGVAVHSGPTITRQRFAEVLSDDDNDGRIVFTPRGGVPLRSVWIGVDIGSGAVSVATPDGFSVDRRELDLKTLKRDSDGVAAWLELETLRADLLVVRPGDGAWLIHGFEGGHKDGDASRNSRLTLRPEDAEPLPGITAHPPKKLKAGDVLIVLDPFRLGVRTLYVTK